MPRMQTELIEVKIDADEGPWSWTPASLLRPKAQARRSMDDSGHDSL